ncbi:hypothetical protein CC78DRAFT_614841 [Lojkania enalia]|uniref:Uncharacterized protein n=1 Tax=Lojkania enalia TaxID=147567 RepID=A0A9P4KCD7_9PLEO|nr:hypothetical protein CC78DRAFT_614841 [Didymosphaeria enalia]
MASGAAQGGCWLNTCQGPFLHRGDSAVLHDDIIANAVLLVGNVILRLSPIWPSAQLVAAEGSSPNGPKRPCFEAQEPASHCITAQRPDSARQSEQVELVELSGSRNVTPQGQRRKMGRLVNEERRARSFQPPRQSGAATLVLTACSLRSTRNHPVSLLCAVTTPVRHHSSHPASLTASQARQRTASSTSSCSHVSISHPALKRGSGQKTMYRVYCMYCTYSRGCRRTTTRIRALICGIDRRAALGSVRSYDLFPGLRYRARNGKMATSWPDAARPPPKILSAGNSGQGECFGTIPAPDT